MPLFGRNAFKFVHTLQYHLTNNPMIANSCVGFVTFFGGDFISQIITNQTLSTSSKPKLEVCRSSDIPSKRENYLSDEVKLSNIIVGSISESMELFDFSFLQGIDYKRSFFSGCLGIAMNGPALTLWYRSLEKWFGTSMTSLKTVFWKCFADQTIYAPFAIVAYFGFAVTYSHHVESEEEGLDVRNEVASTFGTPVGTIGAIYQNPVWTICEETWHKLQTSFIPTWCVDSSLWPFVNFVNFKYIPLYMRPTFVSIVQLCWQVYLATAATTDKLDHVLESEKPKYPQPEL